MTDDLTHYMEATSRLKAECDALTEQLRVAHGVGDWCAAERDALQARMDERDETWKLAVLAGERIKAEADAAVKRAEAAEAQLHALRRRMVPLDDAEGGGEDGAA